MPFSFCFIRRYCRRQISASQRRDALNVLELLWTATAERSGDGSLSVPNPVAWWPEGTDENSPAFQRRVEAYETSVPKDRLRRSLRLSLRDCVRVLRPCPGVETPGYCQISLRDDQTERLWALGAVGLP